MTVTSIKDAWTELQKIFPTDYKYDTSRSNLDDRLEANLPDGKSVNIWIQAPVEAAASDSTEETEDNGSATKEERKETAKRIQRLIYWYTKEYVHEMDNKSARTLP